MLWLKKTPKKRPAVFFTSLLSCHCKATRERFRARRTLDGPAEVHISRSGRRRSNRAAVVYGWKAVLPPSKTKECRNVRLKKGPGLKREKNFSASPTIFSVVRSSFFGRGSSLKSTSLKQHGGNFFCNFELLLSRHHDSTSWLQAITNPRHPNRYFLRGASVEYFGVQPV